MNKMWMLMMGVLGSAGLLAGCGAAATGAPAGGSAKATTARPALVTINMVEAVNAPAYAPISLAQQSGIFKKNGLAVNIVPLSAGSTAAAALISGSAQFDAGVASDALLADSKGNHLISIAALTNSTILDVEIRKQWAQAHHITPAEPLAARLKALQGADIGITAPGSITDLAIRYMFNTVGMKSGVDYHEVAIGSPASNLAALRSNAIQATIFDPSFATLAQDQGVGIIGLSSGEFPVLNGAAFGAVITTQAYAKAHPTITKAVATSIAETNDLILNHPQKALGYIDKQFSSIPKSVLAESIPRYHFARGGRTTAKNWSNMAQIFVGNHLLTSPQASQAVHEFTNQYLPHS